MTKTTTGSDFIAEGAAFAIAVLNSAAKRSTYTGDASIMEATDEYEKAMRLALHLLREASEVMRRELASYLED